MILTDNETKIDLLNNEAITVILPFLMDRINRNKPSSIAIRYP